MTNMESGAHLQNAIRNHRRLSILKSYTAFHSISSAITSSFAFIPYLALVHIVIIIIRLLPWLKANHNHNHTQ